jgi:flagellar motor protein MotB
MFRGDQTNGSERQRDATPAGLLGALVSQAVLSKAASLARKGKYATAESLLEQLISSEKGSPDAMDLLARMHAQQGQFSEAEAFWQRALELEPNSEPYLAGLKRIERIRSRPLWLGILLPMGAAFFAILIVLLVGFTVRDQIVQLRESLLRKVAEANSGIESSIRSSPRIAIDLSSATVKTQENAVVVFFEEGLFLSLADLKPEAGALLSELGKQLQPHTSNISIRVVGHTDDIPVPRSWIYRDNTALGMARAVAVAEFLRNSARLPADLFLLQSAGESKAPYPNDTPANRLRNRTVVIRIHHVEKGQGRP